MDHDRDDYGSNPDLPSNASNGNTGHTGHDPDYDHWVSDEDLQAAMQMEQTVFGRDLSTGASVSLAKRLFKENAAAAAQSIIKTAIHGSTEKVRFDAAKYVLERALGPVSAVGKDEGDGELPPLEAAVQKLMGNTGRRGNGHPG